MLDFKRWWVGVAALVCACATPIETTSDVGTDVGALDGAADTSAPVDAAHLDAPVGDACALPDVDNDHHRSIACGGDDCDDADVNRFPGNVEVCDVAGHDEDCDPSTYGVRDADGDGSPDASCCNTDAAGARHCGDDCDDTHTGVHPGVPEVCNSLDDDCDTAIDEGVLITFHADCDGDLYGAAASMMACTPAACMGHAASLNGDDCDDANAARNPGAGELCNTIDDDCDGIVDEGGAVEICNSLDDDCDGTIDEMAMAVTWYLDVDMDGHGDSTITMSACVPPLGYVMLGGDCDDANANVFPGRPESCDGYDNDCNTMLDYPGEDDDGDGHGDAVLCGGVGAADDCDDGDATVHPGAVERCDRFDDDCSTGGGALMLEDMDSDGHAPPGAACTGGFPRDDCNDGDPNIHPGAPEICDRFDDVCAFGGAALPAEDSDMDMHAPPAATCTGGFPRDDCDDGNAVIHPAPTDLCDRIDGDCSSGGGVDPAEDLDMDMHAPLGATCVGGYPVDDCDDTNAAVHPGLPLLPPRLLGPENGALTGSSRAASAGTLRPTFRWTEDLRTCGTFEIQIDDSCTTPGFSGCTFGSPESSATALSGRTFRPATDLAVSGTAPVGRRYYWRMRTCYGATCGAYGPVRYVDVGRAPSDFDGDGYSDVAIGAPGAVTAEGLFFLYRGTSTGLPSAPDRNWIDPVPAAGDGFANSIAVAGDVNADGYADLIVGSATTDWSTPDNGVAWVFHGGPPFGLQLSAAVELVAPSPQTGAQFGYSVAGAGDVNGDGYADVLVGAVFQSAGATSEGNAFVYHGSATGIAHPMGLPAPPSQTLDDPANQANGWFGTSVSSAGDVNGDGFSDIVVGADGIDAGATDEGNAFVYHGSATGIPAAPSQTLDNPANQASAQFGHGVAGAGDLNGDGFADIVVGARYQDAPATDEGNAFVYYGAVSGIPATPSLTLDSPANQAGSLFGAAISSAGDVNGDGFGDLLIGVPLFDFGSSDTGLAYLWHGSATGITAAPAVTIPSPSGSAGGQFGAAVAGAGDVNGDGYSDLVIGVPGDPSPAGAGSAHVYQGSSSGITNFPASRDLPSGTGTANSFFGFSVARADPARRRRAPSPLTDGLMLQPGALAERRCAPI